MTIRVPLTGVTLGEEEACAAADVIRSGWVTQGERVLRFEAAFANLVHANHAIAVSNCTVGLELAYEVAGLCRGDEVIVPALTFVATANAARRLGAQPVFADVASADDLTINPTHVAEVMTPRTRAVVAVHYAGFAADIDALARVLRALGREDVTIVEDCAHAPGATDRSGGRRCGTLGRIAAFSFFGNKNLTTGEGGMLTTNDDGYADRCRLLRSHGMTTGTWDRHRGHAFTYDVSEVGTNARMDEMRAAVGLVQLQKLEDANRARAQVRGWYLDAFASAPRALEEVQIPFTQGTYGAPSNHLFVVLLPEGSSRQAIMAKLRDAGIQTSIHYPPTHKFHAYRRFDAKLPTTERVVDRLLTLPLGPAMTQAEVGLVVTGLAQAIAAV